MKRNYCYFYLTCHESEKEAIAKALLEKKLVACAKFVPVESMYWWKGNIASDTETLVIFESAEDLFSAVEAEVSKIHSYETFVLSQTPITRINTRAITWLNEHLQEKDDKHVAKLV